MTAITTARSTDDPPSAKPAIEIAELSKTYGPAGTHVLALDKLSLRVSPGEFVCLVGASGCGKSTLLNLIAGLDRPSTGSISVDARRVGLLFQDAALFPWLTAAANIELAMRLRNVAKTERRAQTGRLLELVHLNGFADKRPHELSGGMRQRVALARALAQDADVLLMDEPFGALDAITRDLLHDELESLWLERRFSVLFVTHNVREAVRLGDRVVLLAPSPGRVDIDFTVDLPRPRRLDSPEVSERARALTDRLLAQTEG